MGRHRNFSALVALAVAAAGGAFPLTGKADAPAASPQITWIESSAGSYWQTMPSPQLGAPGGGAAATISVLTGQVLQQIDGFGGAVSELGWQAIQKASPLDQAAIINALYGANGCNFNMSRVPIGSSDFALNAYSDDDSQLASDPNLRNFSIVRDQQNLIPFLKAAQQVQPNLQVWGVPWSPPAWMKTNGNLIGGSINATPQVLAAYANYLVDWAQAYQAAGIPVKAIAPQNEPIYSTNYPSCLWTADQLDALIGTYLGPTLKARDPSVALWLGTLDGGLGNYGEILTDPTALPYVSGVTFQYGGQASIAGLKQTNPNLELVQSESIVTDATNPWSDGQTLFGEIKSFLDAGANSYFNWNMVLNETGSSHWGWAQDCMVTVNEFTGQVTYNPDYYVMRHFSQFVEPGAHEVSSTSTGGIQDIAFVNPDGSTVVLAYNGSTGAQTVAIDVGNQEMDVPLDPGSVSTFVIPVPEPGTAAVGAIMVGGLLLRRRVGKRS